MPRRLVMKHVASALALLLVLDAAPAAGQTALDALSIANDSTLAWCGFVIGRPEEDFYATVEPIDVYGDNVLVTACGHEATLSFDGGRLEYIEVTFDEEGGRVEGFGEAVEARVGPVERVGTPFGDDTFFVPARVPGLVVKLFEPMAEGRVTMGLGFSDHFEDYMPGYRGNEEE